MLEPKYYSKAHGDNSIKKNVPETVCKTKCLREKQRTRKRKTNPEKHQNNAQLGKSRSVNTISYTQKHSKHILSIKSMKICPQVFY